MDIAVPAPSQPAMESATLTPNQHLNFLDGFRGLAALYVVLHHSYLQAWPINSELATVPPGWVAHTMHWLVYGNYAVVVFIMLSGFSLMIPVQRHGTFSRGVAGFYWGRIRRIIPPYWMALVLSIALALPNSYLLHDPTLRPTSKAVVTHLFLVHNWLAERHQLNGPMWSIGVEFQIYLLFPVMVILWRKFGAAAAVAFCGLIALILWRSFGFAVFPAHYFLIFGFGLLASTLVFARQPSSRVLPWCRALFGASLLASSAWVARHGAAFPWEIDLVVGLGAAALVVLAALNPRGMLRRAAEWRPLVFLGAFSYSLYLIHDPLQYAMHGLLLRVHLQQTLLFLVLSTVGTLVILWLAYHFHRAFELPFMASKPTVEAPPKLQAKGSVLQIFKLV